MEIGKGALKALAGEVPFLGPVLTGMFAARQRQVFEQRLAQFLEDLRDEASNFLADQLPSDYLQSQDYLHLIIIACEHAQHTRQREKHRLYARALLSAGTRQWSPRCDLAEELLNALADLSPIEIRVLQAAWEYSALDATEESKKGALETTVAAKDIASRVTDLALDEADIRAYLSKLQRLGLTEEKTGAFVGYEGGAFRLTPLLDRLMELIRVPAS